MFTSFLTLFLAPSAILDFILGIFSPNIQNVLMTFLVKILGPLL